MEILVPSALLCRLHEITYLHRHFGCIRVHRRGTRADLCPASRNEGHGGDFAAVEGEDAGGDTGNSGPGGGDEVSRSYGGGGGEEGGGNFFSTAARGIGRDRGGVAGVGKTGF